MQILPQRDSLPGHRISYVGISTNAQWIGLSYSGPFLKWSWTSAVSSILQTTTANSSKVMPTWLISFMPCCWEQTPAKRTNPLNGTWIVRKCSRISRMCVALVQCWLLPTSVNPSKKLYDQKVCCTKLKPRYLVMVCRKGFQEKHKIASC